MAQPYVTGPVNLFVRLPDASIEYLGTGKEAPRLKIVPHWEPVMNDLYGTKIPMDVAYEGEEAFVAVDLTRWNESVYTKLVQRPDVQTDRGRDILDDIGTLMIHEGASHELWLHFPYTTLKTSMATQPAGYHFRAAYVLGPDEFERLGTVAREQRVIWHCLRKSVAGGGASTLDLRLYDHDMTGLPSIN